MITETGRILSPSAHSQHPIYEFFFPNQPVEWDKEPSLPWFGSDPPAGETTRLFLQLQPPPAFTLSGWKETSINIALEFCLQLERYLISTVPPAEVSSQPHEATQQRRNCPSNTARPLMGSKQSLRAVFPAEEQFPKTICYDKR